VRVAAAAKEAPIAAPPKAAAAGDQPVPKFSFHVQGGGKARTHARAALHGCTGMQSRLARA
jgi:hypothetical protein